MQLKENRECMYELCLGGDVCVVCLRNVREEREKGLINLWILMLSFLTTFS